MVRKIRLQSCGRLGREAIRHVRPRSLQRSIKRERKKDRQRAKQVVRNGKDDDRCSSQFPSVLPRDDDRREEEATTREEEIEAIRSRLWPAAA